MKPVNDSGSFEGSKLASDPATFEKLWHELEAREDARTDPGDGSKVWLRCTGELAPTGSIVIVGVQAFPVGRQLIEFICPRCDVRHTSHLYS
jgi:hypothetical protein